MSTLRSRIGILVIGTIVLAIGFTMGARSTKASRPVTVTEIKNSSAWVIKIDDYDNGIICYAADRDGTAISCIRR
jgi:hypothetical protein